MRADGRWLLAIPLLVGVVACGDGGGGDSSEGDVEAARPPGFEASPAYLSEAIDTSTATPYRFEATVTMGQRVDGELDGVEDVPAVSGQSDGERTSSTSDPLPLIDALGGLPPELEGVDLSAQIVTDGDVAYVHAPGYAGLDLPDGQAPPLAALAEELGDKWGRVDLAALGDDAGQLYSQLNQGQNLEPAFYLELLHATDHVEELGGDIVDGTALVGLAADVPMSALLEAQGIDPAALSAGAPDEELAEAMGSLTLAVEVWLDGEGLLRRLAMDLGEGFAALAEDYDFEGEEEIAGLEIGTDITFSDHGDESITVELPVEADTVDATEAARRLDAQLPA